MTTFETEFFECMNEDTAIALLKSDPEKWGDKLVEMFPHHVVMLSEYANILFYQQKCVESFDLNERILKMKGLSEEVTKRIISNIQFSIHSVEDRYIHYDEGIVDKILNREPKEIPLVTCTITTCKRLEEFKKTMNSFLNCCEDIDMISHWYCVDDNSSQEDRDEMKRLYPFFEFKWKTIEEKGHPESMNMIKDYVKTPYTLHLEDDRMFFSKRSYIRDAMDVVGQSPEIMQCVFNKNYGEIPASSCIKGGGFRTTRTGLRYYVHEYCTTDQEKADWIKKHGDGRNIRHWPHFSLNPSLIRTEVFESCGGFVEGVWFEHKFASAYTSCGYKTAFFEGLYNIHIGPLTTEEASESHPNAYILNGEKQY